MAKTRKPRKRKAKVEEEKVAPDFLSDEGQEESEIQLKEISVSFVRKIAMAEHGGAKFETADFGETRTAVVLEGQNPSTIARQLQEQIKESVTESINLLEAELMGADQQEKEKKVAKKDVNEIGIERKELEGISDIIKSIVSSTTKADLQEVQEEIKTRQDLSETQLNYLRLKFKKKTAELT